MGIRILFEDEAILVVEKPARMVVSDAKTVRGMTVQKWVEKKFKVTGQNSKLKDFHQRAGIVHRLDKETSGILLVAKTPATFTNLQQQFKERKVKKKYLALVHGKVEPKQGEIRVPVGRLTGRGIGFGVRPEGRKAETRYRILRYYDIRKLGKFSFVELMPRTGRTHQIRVHLKYFGHPIVADLLYGGKKRAKKDRQWCPRLFLHASELCFSHPLTTKWVKFQLPLAKDLRKALKNCQMPE